MSKARDLADSYLDTEVDDKDALKVNLSDESYYQQDNILGTVSQSGGVPTGAIIERGSNANGEYVKYADGTLIMTLNRAISYTAESFLAVTLPATLASTLDVGTGYGLAPTATTDYGNMLWLNSPTEVTFRSSKTVNGNMLSLIVIGRWY